MISGYPIWIVLLIGCGVFCASFVDAIGGGGGIISVPVYLLAGLPTHFALGTNKLSSGLGTAASTFRYLKNGFVDWVLAIPSVGFALYGAHLGTKLQIALDERYLKYLLLIVLPVVAFFTLRTRQWPETAEAIPFGRQAAIVWGASLVIGAYDGYYGPGAGTFLMIVFIRLAKLDTRTAGGNMKVVNVSSNLASMFTAWRAGYILWGVGLIAAAFSILAHYLGAGLAIKNGGKIVKPTVILVLILLAIKVLSEILFPGFWA